MEQARKILLHPNFNKLTPEEMQRVYGYLLASGITEEDIKRILNSPFVGNIETLTLENNNFRKVIHTTLNQQLVVMKLNAGEDIGMEIHTHIDQFIRIEKGSGYAILDGVRVELTDGSAVLIPAGTEHNVIAITEIKLYTIYSLPNHPYDRIDVTKPEND